MMVSMLFLRYLFPIHAAKNEKGCAALSDYTPHLPVCMLKSC